MNYFPNSNEEIEVIKFVAKYQYLHITDAKNFFNSKEYYRRRIYSLIDKNFLKRIKWNLVLGDLGIDYVKTFNFEYNALNRDSKYVPRLLYISNLAAFYHNCNTINFNPSFSVKDKEVFIFTARRYIGILEINGIEYLTYHITKKHTYKYVLSVTYDIQKEKKYKNIIVLLDDLSMLHGESFIFGMNQVLIIEDTSENREKLKYMNSVNWSKLIQDYYKNVYLAEYSFCDYTDYKSKYINIFYFLDTEKINRIRYFLRENRDKNITIICDKALQKELQKELPTCDYVIADLEKYIEKENVIYG